MWTKSRLTLTYFSNETNTNLKKRYNMLTRYVKLSNFQNTSKQYLAIAAPALTFKLNF